MGSRHAWIENKRLDNNDDELMMNLLHLMIFQLFGVQQCNEFLISRYSTVLRCWQISPDDRLSFPDLVVFFDQQVAQSTPIVCTIDRKLISFTWADRSIGRRGSLWCSEEKRIEFVWPCGEERKRIG